MHGGKDTTHKTLKTRACVMRLRGPSNVGKSCANESNIVVTCSAGVFIGRANVLLAKAHVETRKRGENGSSQTERGRGQEKRRENTRLYLTP